MSTPLTLLLSTLFNLDVHRLNTIVRSKKESPPNVTDLNVKHVPLTTGPSLNERRRDFWISK